MNAKELILKKINADTNWVDIYTSGVILGEDINNIGDFMTSQVINDLVSKYNTSAFDTEYVGTKIDFIRKAIASETDSNKIAAYNELLRRVYIAEELRIMGKILKINQGMPTNFSDLQQYISSIEEYIESRLNHVNLENYQNTISQFAELKKRLGLSEELTKEEMNIPEVANALKQIKKAKEQMTSNWIYFNLVKFVQEKEYAQQMDAMYEGVKVTFNILNTLRNSPHFSEMFNVLGLNNTILTSLSKRNLIERTIWNNAAHKSSRGQKVIYKKLNSTERSTLKTLVDDTLADTWIKTNIRNSDGSPVRIIWTANEKSNVVTFDGGFDYKLFIKYIETELIPRLRNNGLVINGRTINTADNVFVKHLTFGKDRDGNSIFRLPYNMTQIDKNPGIQMEYEKILSAFGQLRGIILDNGLSIVDMFYLYNLIIHKDKINSRYSLTRLFEDLIASDGGEQLLVFKFNEWLETVNEEEIINKVLGKWSAIHSNIDISEEFVAEEPVTIGFANTSDRVSEEPNEVNYIEPIRKLRLLDDYYRPIFTSEELIAFEEDAKRIFENDFVINERINIHYSEWKTLDDITDMRRWEKIWEDIVYDGNSEESENDFKYNNKSKTVQIPKYIYNRIKLYQKYQKLVNFLMGVAQKNNYYDYYGNLLRHDEDWFGDIGGTSLDILKDLYDLAGIKEIYDDPNQLKLFDSLHIDSDYIAEREEILRNAPRNSEGQLLAPNGKVSKLSEEQWVTVRTKAFKEWFGDWETDPSNASKVLDENGEPLKMYHGSHSQFETFDYDFITDIEGGFFFTSDENYAKQYGTIIYPVFLNVKHPIDTDIPLHRSNLTSIYNKSSIERFDGIIGNDLLDNQLVPSEGWEVMIYNKNQVKSINNRGTFSNLDNTIYDSNPTPVYQTTPSKQSKLIEVVRQANEKGIKGLHAVYQSDLVNEDIYIRSANGFVRNGEIYINVDRAGDDTVIHEFGHLYLADAKNNNRLAYYALLEKVKDTELWKRMRTWAAYTNKVGSDFDEEILATMIGEYYKSGFENYEYESLVKEALELVNPAFIELLNSEILPDLGDTFITNYHFQQKVATWKSKLVSDNILKENCL